MNTHTVEGSKGGYGVGSDLTSQPEGIKPDISDQPGLNPIKRHTMETREARAGYLVEKLDQKESKVYASPGDPNIKLDTRTSPESKINLPLNERRDVRSNWYKGGTQTTDEKREIEKKYDATVMTGPHPPTAESGKATEDFRTFKRTYDDALKRLDVKTEPAILNNIKEAGVLAVLSSGRSSSTAMQELIDREQKSKTPGADKKFYDKVSQKYDKQYEHNIGHLNKKKLPDYSKDDQTLRIDGYNTKTVEPNSVTNQWKYRNEDFIPLYFHDLVNKKFIPFRAFLGSVSEGSNATWSEVQYLGRADKVYVYGGFTRTLTMDFNVQAFSIEELHPMWQRINYLVGLTKPAAYTGDVSLSSMESFIIPPFVKLRLGDMYRNQPVLITDVTTTIPAEASWELVSNEHGQKNNYDYLNGSIVRKGVRSAQYPTMVNMSVSMTLLEKKAPQTIARHFGDSTVESIHDSEDNSLPQGDFNHQLIHYEVDNTDAELAVPSMGVSNTDQIANDKFNSASEDATANFNKLRSKYEKLADQ
jgi:hypothetical protein